MAVHPSAVIHPEAELGRDVNVGPFSVVEKGACLSDGVSVGMHCHVYSGTVLGKNVSLFDGVIAGVEPQDLKYRGEETGLQVGNNTVIREYVTISRGTIASGVTRIGQNCLLMAYCHVAHDCEIGDSIIIANSVQMGGHVWIGNNSVISGLTGIHQFTTIGAGCFIGGGLRVARDIPPYSRAMGEPLCWAGVNEPALKKLGVDPEVLSSLKTGYRAFQHSTSPDFQSSLCKPLLSLSRGARVREDIEEFFMKSKRGILRHR
ncbi:MAG: acyl-ACP--UDP-N-acetylglucosamine O-acyltransferase [Fibrobacteria bacterium]|nr:acyl-ACP--UDP-N-acetylglucosamine O-acyltransferase [Fibrobacteria bacterium]